MAFEVCTNPGQPFGPIGKIASGGELSRFMLALKVVLARLDAAATLIFDEVDAGIGGATADAVGERLARLGDERQVLVVTHAAQVAARADHHFSVGKRVGGGKTPRRGARAGSAERRDEIARMLAGAEVTDAARAAAASLMRLPGRPDVHRQPVGKLSEAEAEAELAKLARELAHHDRALLSGRCARAFRCRV